MLKHGANPNQLVGTEERLLLAVAQGDEAVVELLIKYGALLDYSTYDAVDHAKATG